VSSHASRLALAAVLISASAGCAFHNRTLHLAWPPPGQELAPAPDAAAPAVAMTPVVDLRPEPHGVVGAVRNGFGMRTADVDTPDDVAAWTGAALADALRRSGVRVVEAGPGVPLVGAELRRAHADAFWFYSGDVVLRTWLRHDDAVLYDAHVRGQGSAGTSWAATEKSYAATLTAAMKDATRQAAQGVAGSLQLGPTASLPRPNTPPAATAQAPPAPAEPPELAAPPRRAPSQPVDLYLSVGYDFGFTNLVKVTYSDGTSGSIRANGGPVWAVGATFLKFLDGRLSTRATVGFKYDSLKASNGSVTYTAFPVEVVEQLNEGPVRLGAGLSLSLAPRLGGSGVAASLDTRFDPSVGVLLEARYVFGFGGAPGQGLGIGPRFLWQRLRSTSTGAAVDANALGLAIDFTF
jgi:hypothetical protein